MKKKKKGRGAADPRWWKGKMFLGVDKEVVLDDEVDVIIVVSLDDWVFSQVHAAEVLRYAKMLAKVRHASVLICAPLHEAMNSFTFRSATKEEQEEIPEILALIAEDGEFEIDPYV